MQASWQVARNLVVATAIGTPPAPFAVTRDLLTDATAEDVVCSFDGGRLTSVGMRQGDAEALLGEANRIAGARGIGRIGVMENRLKGTKCRGIFEAPGLTLVGEGVGRPLQELCLPAPDGGLGHLGLAHNGGRAQSLGREEHDPTAPHVLLRRVTIGDHRLQAAARR